MTLSLPTTVDDPATQQNHDRIAQQFPIQAQNIANGAVGSKALAKASVTDEKLAKPTITGIVKVNGEKESGEGFASSLKEAGVYKIELTTELATVGTLTCSTVGEVPIAQCQSVGKKVFEVRTFLSSTLVLTSAKFNFQIKAT